MHKQSLALKFSFVFVVLSMAISLLTAAWQLAQGKSGSLLLVLETGAGLLLVLLPALLSKGLRFYLPAFLYFFFLAFIYCAIYLGDAYHFYYTPYWDKFLHLISGALLFGLAWAILGCFKFKEELPAGFLCLYGVAFAVFCGVLWECYEFTCDGLFAMNLQRYLSAGRALAGRAALLDTMGDLIADLASSLLFSCWSYWRLKNDRSWLKAFFFKKYSPDD
ncbi:hypothetical protein LOB72_03595 [Lactobacillus delbrueckii subsp. lactis]|uniref:hypothetical protein n=2 Tax=Lactobacillus delbrueckii TaxID=1584 RepID=UPI001E524D13|nr:hypothetical protein [Lactobacillus delbrueckii]MCD5447842.1 hypothetical protein [Lactobacillus delbrueckii subsp. lactis]